MTTGQVPAGSTTQALEVVNLRDGHGLPLVLLHAFPLDHRMWASAVDAMPGDFTVLAPDLHGMGRAPDGPRTPGLEASADAVVSAVRAAGYDRAVVAGLSMGGYVAMAIAERHPGFVAGLGLLDTKSTADAPEARLNRLRVAHQVEAERDTTAVLGMVATLVGDTTRAEQPRIVPLVESWIRAQRADGVAWSQRAMAARPDRTHVIHDVAGPVLVLVGDEDVMSPVSAAEHMVVARRDAELVIVPGAGHLSAVERPAQVAEALADLVARASAH
ncbi:pimeloyl-ACP methyl ester carboxylesterase [Sediminihabitans luteus]|uniref:Pimeloyl-ACP methyl ester carboxylesterase n=1 Tax=Sediminihabitans luteus TaxID=1138585 RepID=A0A2M9CDW0_9CELL|nr:alpha/beta hydrolase [Sediminihabitans luteus]PJJ70083.1 pimeloyl-ACP methyl ester carboxylesterase [Sediminihabitans luteus]GIJ00133.1 hydrolase [Sediminihabitans luteus]